MDTRPAKWQRIVYEHRSQQHKLLSENDKQSDVLMNIASWREHKAGLIVTVEHWDVGLELDVDDPRASRYESYLISWKHVAEIQLQLQNKPPRKQQANKGG